MKQIVDILLKKKERKKKQIVRMLKNENICRMNKGIIFSVITSKELSNSTKFHLMF